MTASDQRSPRARLLGMARAAREMESLDARRLSVLGIVRSSFAPDLAMVDGIPVLVAAPEPLCTEADIFDVAYGDPLGGEYWAAWLDARAPDDSVARLLAVHLTIDVLKKRPEDFSDGGVRMGFVEARKRACGAALAAEPDGSLRSRLDCLFKNSNTRHLIPSSLRAALLQPIKESALEATTTTPPINKPPTRRPGRIPIQLPRVIKEMRAALDAQEISPADLGAMVEKTLEKRFCASRDICRRARNEVLSGNVGK